MPLDFLDDVFLLHLPLEAPESVLQSFTFLEPHFRQTETPPARFWICLHRTARHKQAKERRY
jgi:hypothetical protein